MLIFVDTEGEPVQEFSAIYVSESGDIVDVFHHHVKYPFVYDYDFFSRRYIHGLKRDFLSRKGLSCENSLIKLFHKWLDSHPFKAIYAHAPAKESKLLSLFIDDVFLKPWKDRIHCQSHQLALSMKLNSVPLCDVTCHAHETVYWKAKDICNPTVSDLAKMDFFHHCSLYDCVECQLAFFTSE